MTEKKVRDTKKAEDDYLIRTKSEGGYWLTGSIENCSFQAKVYDKPSAFGIRNGRVSKLTAKYYGNGCEVFSYNRGWDKEPSNRDQNELLEVLLHFLESLPSQRIWSKTLNSFHLFLVTDEDVLEFE